jgi:hypothetical protein
MDSLRLDPGALGEALGGTTGGGAERDRDGLGGQDLQQRVDERGLADTGPASDDEHLGNESDVNGLSLALCEHQLRPLLDPPDRLVGIDRRPRRSSDGERPELLGDLPLRPVEAGEEDATAAIEFIGDYGAAFELVAERRLDELRRYFELRAASE